MIQDDCTLRVAAYEGNRLIDNSFSATYTRRAAPAVPMATVTSQRPFKTDMMEIAFAAKSENPELEFFYTLDGSVPTISSSKGSGCFVEEPCIVKVVASDEGMLGPVATFVVKRREQPQTTFVMDGLSSADGVFDVNAQVSWKTQDGMSLYYRVNGGEEQMYDSPLSFTEEVSLEAMYINSLAEMKVSDGDTCWLNSGITTAVLQKTALGDATWIEDQLGKVGWNLLAVTKGISAAHGQEVAAWLTPYGFDAQTKSYVLSKCVESGRCYWVYLSEKGIPQEGRPAQFRYCENGKDVEPAKAWELLSEGASFTFQELLYRMVEPAMRLPGWCREGR